MLLSRDSSSVWTTVYLEQFYSDFKIENVISLVILMKTLKLLITHKDKKVIDFTVKVEDSDHNENENRNPVH